MAALEALLFFVLMPAGVFVIASILLWSAAEETLRSFPVDAFPDWEKGRRPWPSLWPQPQSRSASCGDSLRSAA